MLVLSRREGERVVIEAGGRTILIVVAQTGDRVRLGIEAPPDVRIDREEISQLKRGRFLSPAEMEECPEKFSPP